MCSMRDQNIPCGFKWGCPLQCFQRVGVEEEIDKADVGDSVVVDVYHFWVRSNVPFSTLWSYP